MSVTSGISRTPNDSKDIPKFGYNQAKNPNILHNRSNQVDSMGCVRFNGEMQPSKFGKLVRKARDSKGWTQSDLAREARVDAQSISNIETGVTQVMKTAAAMRVADALGIPRSEAVGALKDFPTTAPAADLLNVSLPRETFERFVKKLGGKSKAEEWLASVAAERVRGQK